MVFPNIENKVQGYVKSLLLAKVANFKDILIFESPDLLNTLKLAEQGVGHLSEFIYILFTSLHGLLTFLPSMFVLIAIAWWIPGLIVLTAIPYLVIEASYRVKSWKIEETQAEAARQLDIYANIILSEEFAKEVRIWSLQTVLLDQWTGLYHATYRKIYRMRLQGAVWTFLSACFQGLGLAIPYVVLVQGVMARTFTLGDLVLLSGLVFQARGGLGMCLGSSNQLLSSLLSLRPIFQFLDLSPLLQQKPSLSAPTSPQTSSSKIVIRDLTFTYPGSTDPALKNIDLTLAPGQMTVVVGENGSGKSTLAKLLCRFYDPQSGEILWNGKDLQTWDIDMLRSQMAVVFQDYAKFPASVRENVGWANLAQLQNSDYLAKLLEQVKLLDFFEQSHDGLETLLTKRLENGTDLSGGQWQRIAIARALARLETTQLLILDEPTAAIDPENEHEIYRLIRQMATYCTTLVISHRLGLARFADQVVVLHNGSIIETGTHTELMQQAGKYRAMFDKQSSQYIDVTINEGIQP
ncbi:MAG TPA: ABC transporter ATP-binding protein [Stenomitos sp.]